MYILPEEEILLFVTGLYRLEPSSVESATATTPMGQILREIDHWDIQPRPVNQETFKLLFYIISSFRLSILQPWTEAVLKKLISPEGDSQKFLDERVTVALDNLRKHTRVSTHDYKHFGDDHLLVDMRKVYFSGEMHVILQFLRRWLNLILRTLYYLSHHRKRCENPRTMVQTGRIYGESFFSAISNYFEGICDMLFPIKLLQNSRLAMDHTPHAIFNICCASDAKRFDQKTSGKWIPWPNEREIVPFEEIVRTLLADEDLIEESDYKTLAEGLIQIQLNTGDPHQMDKLLRDLYEMGFNRVATHFLKVLLGRYRQIGPANVFSDRRILNLNQYLLKLCDYTEFDHIHYFARCMLYSLPKVDPKHHADLLKLTAHSKEALVKNMQEWIVSPQFIKTKETKETASIWKVKKNEDRIDLRHHLYGEIVVDMVRYACVCRGSEYNREYVGFLRFVMLFILTLLGESENSDVTHDHFPDHRTLSTQGKPIMSYYHYCADAVRFIISLSSKEEDGREVALLLMKTHNDKNSKFKIPDQSLTTTTAFLRDL